MSIFRIILFIILNLLISLCPLFAQDITPLEFKSSDDPDHHIIELHIPMNLYEDVLEARGEKMNINADSILIDGHATGVEDLHLRGNTTLHYERKSYSVSLSDAIQFNSEGNVVKLKAFYLVSLTMDKNYYRNRLAFDLLKQLGLFSLYYHYAEVKINNVSQGIYLLLQRPQDWAKKTEDSPYVIRKGRDHRVKKEMNRKTTTREDIRKYRKMYYGIYKTSKKKSGEELYQALSELMDFEQYATWLGFNYFVKNGDYADELYHYIDPGSLKYKIIPWDYDDIFSTQPHEGWELRKKRLDTSLLIFSSEDPLDIKIAMDPFLYKKYQELLLGLLTELTEKKIKSIMDKIYIDLAPLFHDQDIITAVSKDGYKTNLTALEEDMKIIYSNLVFTKNSMRGMLQR
jgi:spore coat protein H